MNRAQVAAVCIIALIVIASGLLVLEFMG